MGKVKFYGILFLKFLFFFELLIIINLVHQNYAVKKISLYFLIIGLTVPLFSYSNQANQALKQSLIVLNKYWKEVEVTCIDHAKPETETELIKLHLKLVVDVLQNKDVTNLNTLQQTNRVQLLNELEIYGRKGIFPLNTNHEERTPYFIDELGTACAVGQMIIKSGKEHLAKSISKDFNYLYIEDMPQEPIKKWAKEHGFTVDELKWIQPGYGPQCPLDSAIPSSCPSGFGCFNPDLYKTNLDSATVGVEAIERNIGNGWYRDSLFANWYMTGYIPFGIYRFALRDSLNNRDTIYYDILGPTPFILNDTVLQRSNGCLNTIQFSAQNGSPPYRFRLRSFSGTYFNSNSGRFDSICAGRYIIILIDSNNCPYEEYITIGGNPTSIDEISINNRLVIQNPVVNNQLILNTDLIGSKVIRIINLNGKVVTEFKTSENNINQNLEVRNGLYILELIRGKERFQKKIIITN